MPWILYALLALAIVIAVLGIINTLRAVQESSGDARSACCAPWAWCVLSCAARSISESLLIAVFGAIPGAVLRALLRRTLRKTR